VLHKVLQLGRFDTKLRHLDNNEKPAGWRVMAPCRLKVLFPNLEICLASTHIQYSVYIPRFRYMVLGETLIFTIKLGKNKRICDVRVNR